MIHAILAPRCNYLTTRIHKIIIPFIRLFNYTIIRYSCLFLLSKFYHQTRNFNITILWLKKKKENIEIFRELKRTTNCRNNQCGKSSVNKYAKNACDYSGIRYTSDYLGTRYDLTFSLTVKWSRLVDLWREFSKFESKRRRKGRGVLYVHQRTNGHFQVNM